MSEMIYGKNTMIEMIKSGHKINEILITEPVFKKDVDLVSLIKQHQIPYRIEEKKKLDTIASGNHQGVVAYIEPFKYYELYDLLDEAKRRNEPPFFIILDGLEDPHNLGAILRTGDACGVHGVIIPKNRSVSLNATVAKLSTGAIEYLKVARVTNLTATIKELKHQGVWIVGTDADTVNDYRRMDAKEPIAIVIGNEGKGISRLVKENCDMLVRIPMKGNISSLNASVATSILMYEVLNQRCPLE